MASANPSSPVFISQRSGYANQEMRAELVKDNHKFADLAQGQNNDKKTLNEMSSITLEGTTTDQPSRTPGVAKEFKKELVPKVTLSPSQSPGKLGFSLCQSRGGCPKSNVIQQSQISKKYPDFLDIVEVTLKKDMKKRYVLTRKGALDRNKHIETICIDNIGCQQKFDNLRELFKHYLGDVEVRKMNPGKKNLKHTRTMHTPKSTPEKSQPSPTKTTTGKRHFAMPYFGTTVKKLPKSQELVNPSIPERADTAQTDPKPGTSKGFNKPTSTLPIIREQMDVQQTNSAHGEPNNMTQDTINHDKEVRE